MNAVEATPLPSVAGYIEAVTADRVLGWAWLPSAPAHRAVVELHLGTDVIASATADQPRADLAGNGIGDGAHAFELAIPAAARDRGTELRVLVRHPNGAMVPIGMPVAEGVNEHLAKLQRGIDALVGSQRLMHRNLQAALTGARNADPTESLEAAAAGLSAMQAEIAGRISDLERFVVRLDAQLAGHQAPGPTAPAHVSRAALVALAVSGVALAVSFANLLGALSG